MEPISTSGTIDIINIARFRSFILGYRMAPLIENFTNTCYYSSLINMLYRANTFVDYILNSAITNPVLRILHNTFVEMKDIRLGNVITKSDMRTNYNIPELIYDEKEKIKQQDIYEAFTRVIARIFDSELDTMNSPIHVNYRTRRWVLKGLLDEDPEAIINYINNIPIEGSIDIYTIPSACIGLNIYEGVSIHDTLRLNATISVEGYTRGVLSVIERVRPTDEITINTSEVYIPPGNRYIFIRLLILTTTGKITKQIIDFTDTDKLRGNTRFICCNSQYDIVAFAAHRGTLHSGHYIAYVNNPADNLWYEYNDMDTESKVNRIPNNHTLQRMLYPREFTPYLLLFQRALP